jgi:hypothetical protein
MGDNGKAHDRYRKEYENGITLRIYPKTDTYEQLPKKFFTVTRWMSIPKELAKHMVSMTSRVLPPLFETQEREAWSECSLDVARDTTEC